MSPAARAQQRRSRATTAAGVYAGAKAGEVAAAAPASAVRAVASSATVPGVATAGVLSGFITWLAELRRQHQAFLVRRLAKYGKAGDVAGVVRAEMLLEAEYARRAADRLATKLPLAYALNDPREREAKVRQILADEERFARMRREAMMARAIAALTRTDLRASSPLGAFWKLGMAQQHTAGCLFMAGKFWPWAVLERVHPPRHYGCTSSLHGYHEAITAGWMSPGDVPDTRAAVRAAAGVMMEHAAADALLAELDIRDRLEERGVDTSAIPFAGVAEAFDAGKHPRGYHGRFRKVAAVAAALKRGEEAELEPEHAPALVDALADGSLSSLHKLQVTGHPNLFRAHARELPRSQMPQIPKDHLPGFMEFLRSKRIAATVDEVAPSQLRATQNQVNGGSVAAMAKGWDPARGGMIMASRDGDVLDGHHRWAAAALHELTHSSYRMQVLRFTASTDRMLALMREYNAQVGIRARGVTAGGVPSYRTVA